MRVALIVTTFDRPDALARVLASVAAQRRPPDELVVADDGSGPETARLVRTYAAAAAYRVRPAGQPHAGFRVARAATPRPALLAVTACNQAIWRADFVAVNGFDEDYVGWGSEDKDLCARLGFAGIRSRGLLFSGLAWHLDHPPAARTAAAATRPGWLPRVRSGTRGANPGWTGTPRPASLPGPRVIRTRS